MKILWNKNPLETVTELESDLERELFRLRIDRDLLHWATIGAEYYLNGKHTDVSVAKALEECWVNDSKELKKRVDSDYEMYLAELSGIHCGDCTCFPASCMKCHAEDLAGVNTIKGLGKHSAHNLVGLFKDGGTPEEALHKLANPDYSKVSEAYKGHEKLWFDCVPGWTADSHRAHAWLKQYYEDHPEVLKGA